MDKIKDYDGDGFELFFEDEHTPEEKKYFVQTYTNVDMVAERRLHCTCCDTHIGTAPSAEKIIRMHPVLRVTQCIKCFRFYNSGEFEKGEDGSELYCRWCGQGGDVYCCSDCPYVFCKKCILRNLTRVALNDVTSNDNWKCFSCAPKILHHLRAQHWALVNFIEKQKKKLLPQQKTMDPDAFVDAMNRDVSQCCKKKKTTDSPKKRKIAVVNDSDNESNDSNWNRRKKRKKTSVADSDSDAASVDSEGSTKRKRAAVAAAAAAAATTKVAAVVAPSKISTSVAQEKAVSSITKNPNIQVKKVSANQSPAARKSTPQTSTAAAVAKPKSKQQQPPPPPAAAVASTDAAEIDCSPDLFAFLVNHAYGDANVGSTETAENSVSSSTSVRAPPPQPPPLAMPANSITSDASAMVDVPMETAQRAPVTGQRQYVRRVARVTQGGPNDSAPVIHNYNGYRIDLNKAAQQSTLRLPNGKVIHVRKQVPLNSENNNRVQYSILSEVPASSSSSSSVQPLPPQPIINQQRRSGPTGIRSSGPHSVQRMAAAPPRMASALRPTALSRSSAPPNLANRPPPPLIINSVSSGVPMPALPGGSNGHLGLHQAQMQMQHMLHHQQAQQMPPNAVRMPATSAGPAPMAVPGVGPATASSIPLPRIYGCEPVGKARTQLERQIFNAIQICHHIDGKLKTLMNSNAYKNVKKMHEIKELYIHLSYLFTYTNGRFQSVHDKCMEDMRRLGFESDATSLSSGNVIDKYGSDVDEDDLEIVEPDHQTIDVVDSDDERSPEKSKSKSTPQKNAAARSTAVTSAPPTEAGRQVMLDITSSTENLENVECDVDVTSLLQIDMNEQDEDDENGESLLRRMNDDVGIATPPDFEQNDEQINIENDLKLNSKATVNLKPVEQEFPELVKEARRRMDEGQQQAAEKAQQSETAADVPDANSEIDGIQQKQQQQQQEEPTASEEEVNPEQQQEHEKIVQENTVSEANNDAATAATAATAAAAVEIVNLDDSVESINSDSECTNSNVEDTNQVAAQDKEAADNQTAEQSQQVDEQNVEKPNETVAENEPEKEPEQNEQDSVELISYKSPQQHPESQAEQSENCEPAAAQEENSNDDVIATTNEETDFTENEAQSIDDNSDGGNDAPEQAAECHGEITSTNENEDVEMREIVDDGNTSTTDKNDCCDESNDIDNNQMNVDNGVDVVNAIVDIPDIANEEIITEEMITDAVAADDCIALEETVGGGDSNDGNEQPTGNETESIFSDLSDCNQLVNEDISNVISTSASLDVASLLESGDFENISSPEAFN